MKVKVNKNIVLSMINEASAWSKQAQIKALDNTRKKTRDPKKKMEISRTMGLMYSKNTKNFVPFEQTKMAQDYDKFQEEMKQKIKNQSK